MAHNRGVGLAALPLAITLVVAPAQLKIESGAAPATVTESRHAAATRNTRTDDVDNRSPIA